MPEESHDDPSSPASQMDKDDSYNMEGIDSAEMNDSGWVSGSDEGEKELAIPVKPVRIISIATFFHIEDN